MIGGNREFGLAFTSMVGAIKADRTTSPKLWLSTSGTPSILLKQALPTRQIHRKLHKILKPFPNRADFNSMDMAQKNAADASIMTEV